MEKRNEIRILDCTIRDGGYLNKWRFDKRMVREVYKSLSKAGVDIVELGFRGTQNHFDKNDFGLWRFTDAEDLREVTSDIEGAKIALMGDYGKMDTHDISDEYRDIVSLVRMAVHKDNALDAIRQLEKIKENGYAVSINAMGITSYSRAEIDNLVKMLADSNLDCVYIADSYGSILPDDMRGLIEPFKSLEGIKIGFHPHNSLQMSFANALEAMKCGVDIIDSTIYGLGRGAGNLPTEVILSYLQLSTKDKYNVIPVLDCIDRFFLNLDLDEPWGYQLPYMLSGIFQCHPYYPKTLINYREYSMEDIWNALEVLRKINPIGFSKDILNDITKSGMIGGLKKKKTVEKVLPGEKKSKESTVRVPYLDRHSGRDFLIIASGPTLKDYAVKIEKFIDKYDPIVLGANYLSGLFRPDYHAFNNKKRFKDYIDAVHKDSKLLLGENLPGEMIREFTARDYERLYFIDELQDFDIIEGVIHSNCRTIAVLLMGIAIVMGAKRIFAVGMDGYSGMHPGGSFHFYDEKVEPEEMGLIIERHQYNQHYMEQIDQLLNDSGKEGIYILTPTSYKAFYKGIENYL